MSTKIFVAPGEHSFSLFQEENISWSICVLLTSPLINIGLQILEDATRETEHRSAMHSAPSLEVCHTLLV